MFFFKKYKVVFNPKQSNSKLSNSIKETEKLNRQLLGEITKLKLKIKTIIYQNKS